MAVTGCNFVRFSRHGLQAIRHYWQKMGDRFEVRRQALKLRFWDERHEHPPGLLCDLSYERIQALAHLGIYEARVDDEIGGQSNIRIAFFDPPTTWTPQPGEERPNRVIWVLEALPKKRNNWTVNDITRFEGARLVIVRRFYVR